MTYSNEVIIEKSNFNVGERPDYTKIVREAIEKCKKLGHSRLIFSPGRYDFWGSNEADTAGAILVFEDCHNLEIEGFEAELVFHDFNRAFVFEKCSNISIKGIKIDWEEIQCH